MRFLDKWKRMNLQSEVTKEAKEGKSESDINNIDWCLHLIEQLNSSFSFVLWGLLSFFFLRFDFYVIFLGVDGEKKIQGWHKQFLYRVAQTKIVRSILAPLLVPQKFNIKSPAIFFVSIFSAQRKNFLIRLRKLIPNKL